MSLKDKLEIGLKPDAPYRPDNMPEKPTPEAVESADEARERAAEVGDSSQPVSDAWITAKIQSKLLVADAELDRGIDVWTTDGVVRLTGTVPGPAERQEAERIAADTDGVLRVVNELQLG